MEDVSRFKLKEIKNVQRKNSEIIDQNSVKYKDAIEAYHDYLDYVSYLIKTLSIPDIDINRVIILGMLIKKGIFSEDNQFFYEHDKNEIKGYPGISIVKGIGDDNSISHFSHDTLDKFDTVCEPLYVRKALKDGEEYTYDHKVINLIEFRNNIYGYDIVDDRIYAYIHDGFFKELFTKRNAYLMYDGIKDMEEHDKSIQMIKSFERVMDSYRNRRIMGYDEYKIFHDFANFKTNNPRLLNDFNNSSKKLIKRITDNLR